MFVKFKSDSSYNKAGFLATYSIVGAGTVGLSFFLRDSLYCLQFTLHSTEIEINK